MLKYLRYKSFQNEKKTNSWNPDAHLSELDRYPSVLSGYARILLKNLKTLW